MRRLEPCCDSAPNLNCDATIPVVYSARLAVPKPSAVCTVSRDATTGRSDSEPPLSNIPLFFREGEGVKKMERLAARGISSQ